MQILLKCRNVSGSIALSAGTVAGLLVPERRYQITNHLVILEGFSEVVLHHDADQLLAQDDGLFRMLTPAEQDAITDQQRATASVQESVSPESAPSQSAQEASADNSSAEPADSQPPALLDKIKKVSAGG